MNASNAPTTIPKGKFGEKLRHLLMPHYPYGMPVIGWKREIEKLTAADARDFYTRITRRTMRW